MEEITINKNKNYKEINQNDFDEENNMKVSHGKKQHVIVKII